MHRQSDYDGGIVHFGSPTLFSKYIVKRGMIEYSERKALAKQDVGGAGAG